MNRQIALKIVNPLLGLAFIVQAGSGMFSTKIPYELFRSIHQYGGWALTALVFAHVVFNWSWIKNSVLR